LYGYGGPFSQGFIDKAADIQKFIIDRLKEYGMVPVGPLFYASVPPAMKKYYPEEDIRPTGKWITYDRPAILNPSTPFFQKVSAIYY
jgi:alpha-N-acetylglucosaminidase